ncbi:MAG: hypothetical protein ABJN69_17205 [Hellea sp.]
MSFFKKKKSKSKKAATAPKPDQSEIERDVAKMDQDRHLDMQLEELTARLNIKTEENQDVPSEAIPTQEKDNGAFLTKSLQDFTAPTFTASLDGKTKNIDVTSETPQVTTNIDKILTEARKEAEDLAAAENSLPTPQATDPAKAPLPDVSTDLNLSGPKRFDMSEMRVDVAKISADIQGGEELYRRALQRVEGLMTFVEKAEVDFSVLNRLEPENRRLKAKLRTANGDVENFKGKLSLLTADLEDHQERLDGKTKQYEEARGKLTTAANSLREYERVLKETKTESERYSLAIDRHKTALNVEGKENKVLREKIVELSTALEARQSEHLAASKMVESLKADCSDLRDQAESFRTEAQDLRITLSTAKRQNNAMKGEMLALHEDIKTFKTQYEFNVINREDQVTDLEAQIAFLAKEVDAKTELANAATHDISALRGIRSEQDIERDRLEKQLAAATAEIRDVTSLAESRNAEKIKALRNEIRELQAQLIDKDENSQSIAKAYADLQRQSTTTEMERERLQARLDLQSQQLENAINNDPASKLEGQIKNLAEQLQIKDEIVRSAAQDVTRLRQDRDKQKAEQKRLEDLIHSQTFQLEAAQKALLESKQSETELDQKYKDIAAALSVSHTRRRSEAPAENPDIAPELSSEYKDLTGDDIENRIMDYKFGIRKDIV